MVSLLSMGQSRETHGDRIPKILHGDPRDTPTCLDTYKGEQWILMHME